MKVYTRTGDKGLTSLVGGTRVFKTDARLEAYGTVDELNSWLGLLYASPALPQGQKDVLLTAMNNCFNIGSALATEPESAWQPQPFDGAFVDELEQAIDAMEASLPRHNQFILPAGHPDAARANIARTVARRAERRILALDATTDVDPAILRYVNRLSDYLFVLGRAINHQTGHDEIFWQSPRRKQ